MRHSRSFLKMYCNQTLLLQWVNGDQEFPFDLTGRRRSLEKTIIEQLLNRYRYLINRLTYY